MPKKKNKTNDILYVFALLKKQKGCSALFDMREDLRRLKKDLLADGSVSSMGFYFRSSVEAEESNFLTLFYDEKNSLFDEDKPIGVQDEIERTKDLALYSKVFQDYIARDYDYFFHIRMVFDYEIQDLVPIIKDILPCLSDCEKFYTVIVPKK